MNLARRISQPSQVRAEPVRAFTPVPVWSPESVAILGESIDAAGLPLPVSPSPHALFGPRGCCIVAEEGPLWVADSGHHRLLGWQRCPREGGMPADWVIGQPDFYSEGRNAKRDAGPQTLNVPTGIVSYGAGLAVADAWNHRVLIWRRLPQESHCPPDIVLGQQDFMSVEINQGRSCPSADTLYWPYGVSAWGNTLAVADTGNRRVLLWHDGLNRNGQPADLVLGQQTFDQREENAGGVPCAMSMRWPHAIARWGKRLCVADAGNNRIMVWSDVPSTCGAPCHLVLGQPNETHVDHNTGDYWPGAGTLNMPYGVASQGDQLIVADTANSRLVGWHGADLATGISANALAGQQTFQKKGDNQWSVATRETLCWPYGVSLCDGTLAIADSGNNRVLIRRLHQDLMS